jgi:hypothetical protein
MIFGRKDDDAKMLATRALGAADSARQAIEMHMVDCTRRYETLRADGERRVSDLRTQANEQHQENQRRMNGLEKGQAKIFWAIVSAMGLLLMAGVETLLRMLH